MLKFAAAVVCATALLPVSANATTYYFTISGAGITASGSITADTSTSFGNPWACGTCASGPGYAITGISGTVNGAAITGLLPSGSYIGNDNRIYPTSTPFLDWGDIGFQTATNRYNVYDAHFQGIAAYLIGSDAFGDRRAVEFTLSDKAPGGGVPEPAAWALLIAGFGLTGAALRRRTAALA
jgi:hypothetical protein